MKRLTIFSILVLVFLLMSCSATKSLTKSCSPNYTVPKRIVAVKLFGEVDPEWMNKVEDALKSANGSPVILNIESPGGYVSVSIALHDFLVRMKQKYSSKIYVYSQYGCYSGAYYMAVAANEIYIAPSAEIGSIGVVYELTVVPKKQKDGEELWIFKSGTMKWIGVGDTITQEQASYIQGMVDKYYLMFLEAIVDGRKIQLSKITNDTLYESSLQYLRKICDGRVYFPKQALDLGLVDGVMYLDDLVAHIKKIYKIKESVEMKVEWK